MEGWVGHRPVTREALLAIFDRVISGVRAPSQSERAFVIACEFWAAAQNNELATRFPEKAALSFLAASEAFRSIGARDAADELQRVVGAWSRSGSVVERKGHLKGLGRRLAFGDDIESTIAAYAGSVLRTLRADVNRRSNRDA